MEWTPVSSRIITARFYSQFRRLTVIQAYATQNERADEEKEQFYEMLQQAVDQCNRQNIIIVMVDLDPCNMSFRGPCWLFVGTVD